MPMREVFPDAHHTMVGTKKDTKNGAKILMLFVAGFFLFSIGDRQEIDFWYSLQSVIVGGQKWVFES